jgi:hypothetical protein
VGTLWLDTSVGRDDGRRVLRRLYRRLVRRQHHREPSRRRGPEKRITYFYDDDYETIRAGEAFRVLIAARSTGALAGVTIGVRGGAETPAAVLEAADVVLPTPHDAARLLSALARELERRLRPTREAIAAAVPVDVATPAEPARPDEATASIDDRRVESS